MNKKKEAEALAEYVQGMADATENEKLHRAAEIIRRWSQRICAGGIYDCNGGDDCTSDHK